jgi:hypothetical protein
VKDGVVSAVGINGAEILVDSLKTLKWSKPLAVHWFCGNLRIVASAKNCPERSFLETAAHALGARLVETDEGYTLLPDLTALRARLTGMAVVIMGQPVAGEDPGRTVIRNTWSLAEAVLPHLSDAQLEKSFSKAFPRSFAIYEVPKDSNVVALAEERIKALRRAASKNPTVQSTLDKVDWNEPYRIAVRAPFDVRLAFVAVGGGTVLL